MDLCGKLAIGGASWHGHPLQGWVYKREPEVRVVRLVTLEEYISLPRPKLEWLLERLIPKPGIVMLTGPPKKGKSRLAMQIGLALAQGKDFLGQVTKTPRKVLYLQPDMPEPDLLETLAAFKEAGIDTSGNFSIIHPDEEWTLSDIRQESAQKWVREALDAADPELVIIDVLRNVHNADENKSVEMKPVAEALKRVFKGRSVLLLHHTKKNLGDGRPSPEQAVRGGYIAGECTAIWLLYQDLLTIQSRHDADLKYKVEMNEWGLWTFPEMEEYTSKTEKVLQILTNYPELSRSRQADLAKHDLGISRATFYRMISGRDTQTKISSIVP